MSEQQGSVFLDAASLKALAHPLRIRLLNLLREYGPATATDLARRVGDTTSGTTSYHLRRLAVHGFVVESHGRSVGRKRCWAAAHSITQLNATELMPDPETRPAMLALLDQTLELQLEWLRTWLRAAPTYGPEWADNFAFSDRLLRLSPQRMRQLISELGELMSRYDTQTADSAPQDADIRPVVVLLYAFPRADLDNEGSRAANQAQR